MEAHELLLHVRLDPESGCWLWQGCQDRHGYGLVYVDGVRRRAHRAIYEQVVGPIPERMVLDHLLAGRPRDPGPCRSRACCNPGHLEPVPVSVNSQRVRNWHAAKSCCPAGHSYAEHGKVYRGADGRDRRYCVLCCRENARRSHARHRRPQA